MQISAVQYPAENAHSVYQKGNAKVMQPDHAPELLKATQNILANDLHRVTKAEQARTSEHKMLLKENEHQYQILFEQSPIGIGLATTDGVIIAANIAMQTVTGYSEEELKKIKFIDMYEDLKQRTALFGVLSRHGEVADFPMRLKRKDGTSYNALLNVRIIPEEADLLQITIQDITELIKGEKQLQMMSEKLRVVGTLTRHDVRNKLTAIMGNVALAGRKMERNEQATNNLDEIRFSVRQIVRIFDFASAFEKLGVEKLEYFDVAKSIEDAVWLFPDLRGVRLINETHGLTVLADSLLTQLFYNLVDNSLKHGEKTSQISIRYETPEENRCVIVYEDDGVGIPLEAKSRLFEEGFNIGNGPGYGLYLVKKMLEIYGWTIREEGEPGKGAKFAITIPRKRPSEPVGYKVTEPSIILQDNWAKHEGLIMNEKNISYSNQDRAKACFVQTSEKGGVQS